MIRWLIALLMMAAPVLAQDGPTLTMDVKETEAIPGQPLSVRITVLVPTYMPSPPVWPGYEAPNLMVRLPEKSTSPASQRVNGQTWAGITRRYQISPMIPGSFTLPAAEVTVTWADPDTNEPVRTTLPTEPVTLTGILPDGAEGLDPFVAAIGLTLSQTVEGAPGSMVPGDSVIRTVTAEIDGTSPMFLPTLLPVTDVPGLRVYPDEPVLEIRDNRGALSGTRTERVTFLAEYGGAGTVPGVSLNWYNLDTGQIETATADAIDIVIDGPPPAARATADRRQYLLIGMVLVAALAVLTVLNRFAWPPLRRRLVARRQEWRASEAFAWRALRGVVRQRDLPRLHPALDFWAARVNGPDPRQDPRLVSALLQIGQARYGTVPGASAAAGWQALAAALPQIRRVCHGARPGAEALPGLNG